MATMRPCMRIARVAISSFSPRIAGVSIRSHARRQIAVENRAFSVSAIAHVKKYTEDHEWIEMDSDGTTGVIGVSTYAAKALGDVVFVELPTPDSEVSAGDTIGAVESVKSASDILTPVSGTILEGNSVLDEKPSTINKSPESDGWIAKIKVNDVKDLESLMDEEAYLKYTED